MAILKTVNRQQEKLKLIKPSFVPMFNYDAHMQAYRDHLIQNFQGKVAKVKVTGKPLRAQKWYQPDYRSATPKGVVLLAPQLRGQTKRFAVN